MQLHRETVLLRRSDDSTYTKAGVTVTVYVTDSTSTLATVYSDSAGATVVSGSALTTDRNGEVTFYAADGVYDLKITGTGLSTRWVTKVQILEETPYVYDVTSYGADPTGATDSTASIQSAMDACESAGGGTVFFPSGTYLVTSAGMVVGYDSPVVFKGDNAWLDGATTADHAFRFDTGGGSGYPTFERVEFVGLKFKRFAWRVIECSTYDTSGRSTVTRFAMTNCEFDACGQGLFLYAKTNGVHVEGNVFTDLVSSASDGGTAIWVGTKYQADRAETNNVVIRNNIITGSINSHASADMHNIIVFARNVVIDGNILRNNRGTGASPGVKGIGVKSSYVTICNNILENSGTSSDGHIYVKGRGRGEGTGDDNGGESYAIAIYGNKILSTDTEAWNASEFGIGVDGGIYTKDSIWIHHNTIEGLRGGAIQVETSTSTPANNDDVAVDDNMIISTRSQYGIQAVVAGNRMSISRNMISGIGDDGVTADPIGIWLRPAGDVDNWVVEGNLISDRGYSAGSGNTYGIYYRPYSTNAPDVTNLLIARNKIDLTSAGGQVGMSLYVSAGTLTGVEITDNVVNVVAGQTVYSQSSTARSIITAAGTGTPEGVVRGSVGSVFRRTDGGAGTTLYIKESGDELTGWAAV